MQLILVQEESPFSCAVKQDLNLSHVEHTFLIVLFFSTEGPVHAVVEWGHSAGSLEVPSMSAFPVTLETTR